MVKMSERREFDRFEVSEGSFVAFGSHPSKLGQITDLSRGGLAFRYVENNLHPHTCSDLNIIVANNGFYLKGMPFKTISNSEIAVENIFSSIMIRHHSIKFGDMTNKQITQLNYFINHFTTDIVQPNHSAYEVINEKNDKIGIHLLVHYYGNLWRSALDRLNHQVDGYLLTIKHKGQTFRIYRKHITSNRYFNSTVRLA